LASSTISINVKEGKINKCQRGFTEGADTSLDLLEIIDFAIEEIQDILCDKRKYFLHFLIYLKQAYDSEDRTILLEKLTKISVPPISQIYSVLNSREQLLVTKEENRNKQRSHACRL
jgi:hypothetical protein